MMFLILMFFWMLFISIMLMLLNFNIQKKKKNDREKLSPFECGFDPLSPSRLPFSIHFYLIGIIFLIFDIEIIIFIPMIPSFQINSPFYWTETTLIFILILLIGLYLEWYEGALTWLK